MFCYFDKLVTLINARHYYYHMVFGMGHIHHHLKAYFTQNDKMVNIHKPQIFDHFSQNQKKFFAIMRTFGTLLTHFYFCQS